MKKLLGISLLVSIAWITALAAYNRVTGEHLVNSLIDSTSIGATTPSTGAFTAISGPLTGNVTGNLTGNVTGNVSGNAGTATALAVTGKLTGTCATSTTAWNTCSNTVPLSATLPDTNYNATCSLIGVTGYAFIQNITKSTTSLTVVITNGDTTAAVASSASEIDCHISGT